MYWRNMKMLALCFVLVFTENILKQSFLPARLSSITNRKNMRCRVKRPVANLSGYCGRGLIISLLITRRERSCSMHSSREIVKIEKNGNHSTAVLINQRNGKKARERKVACDTNERRRSLSASNWLHAGEQCSLIG